MQSQIAPAATHIFFSLAIASSRPSIIKPQSGAASRRSASMCCSASSRRCWIYSLLTVGWNIDTAIDLVPNHCLSCPEKQIFGHLGDIVLGIGEGAGNAVILLIGFGEAADLDIVGFRISADAGCGDSHRSIILEEACRIKALIRRFGLLN